jgi:hypothetical protein
VHEDDVEIVMATLFDIRSDVRYLVDLLDLDEEDDDDSGEEEES